MREHAFVEVAPSGIVGGEVVVLGASQYPAADVDDVLELIFTGLLFLDRPFSYRALGRQAGLLALHEFQGYGVVQVGSD